MATSNPAPAAQISVTREFSFTADFIEQYKQSHWKCYYCKNENEFRLPHAADSGTLISQVICTSCRTPACVTCKIESGIIKKLRRNREKPDPTVGRFFALKRTEAVGWVCCTCGLSHRIWKSSGHAGNQTLPLSMIRTKYECQCVHDTCPMCLTFSLDHDAAYTVPETPPLTVRLPVRVISTMGGISLPQGELKHEKGHIEKSHRSKDVPLEEARSEYSAARWLQEQQILEDMRSPRASVALVSKQNPHIDTNIARARRS